MRELKVGDKVDMHDGSYCFGINNGRYVTNCPVGTGDRQGLEVVEIELDTMEKANGNRSGPYTSVCDILVTNNKGGFWFTQSRLASLCKHTITIDGKDINVSAESYENLKRTLCVA